MKLRLVYFGSPDFSAHILERIIKEIPDVSVDLVVTQPDRPVGRKHILTPTPVKIIAKRSSIKVVDNAQISIANDFGNVPNRRFGGTRLSEQYDIKQILKNTDLALVFAYGQIIPDEILQLPKYGLWNIHPSFLPEFRGPSPLVFPILLGYKETGVTLMQMDAKMDHGPIIAQAKLLIDPDITHDLLLNQASDLGFDLFKKKVASNKLQDARLDQNHNEATFTKLLKREDGFIPYSILEIAMKNEPLNTEDLPSLWQYFLKKNPNSSHVPDLQNSGKLIYDCYRALHSWPGVWTLIEGKRMKILNAKLEDNQFSIETIQFEGGTPRRFSANLV